MGNGKQDDRIRLDRLDMDHPVESKEVYERKLKKRQTEMLHVQQAYWHEKRRAIVVFEGWDAAGKGGAIRRLTELLDPRGTRVWPIAKPEPAEQGRHYLYRFWQKLPEPGNIAIFDRSWYGRVLVERVEGFAPKEAWKRAYDEINEFERLLTDDGVRIVKLFLHITPEVQLERFAERLRNPYKRWKLTEEDIRNRERWDEYVRAIHDMFDRTHRPNAPWHAIPANHKWSARLAVMRRVIDHLADGVSLEPPQPDPETLRRCYERLGLAPDGAEPAA
ncbi:MAG TPA: polyphosphate kinase [Alphaproteobacteria bacterium]|nr:polyphosphate kinase [Alphaproteobacteria bacterium]